MDEIAEWQAKLAKAGQDRKNSLLQASRDHLLRMKAELDRWQQENEDIEHAYLTETEGLTLAE